MSDLNQFGGACRCLLRLREDEGKSHLTDREFLYQFRGRFPRWDERPGIVDTAELVEICRDFELAGSIAELPDYYGVLAEHRLGRSVLVRTSRVPDEIGDQLLEETMTLVLQEMSEDSFRVWCPFPNGRSDFLERAPRALWKAWGATGLVLHRVEQGQAFAERCGND